MGWYSNGIFFKAILHIASHILSFSRVRQWQSMTNIFHPVALNDLITWLKFDWSSGIKSTGLGPDIQIVQLYV